MNPKKIFIPFLIIMLTALTSLTVFAQRRGVGYSGSGRLPHGSGYTGGGYRGGYGGYHGYGGYGGYGRYGSYYGRSGYYGRGGYYGGYGGYYGGYGGFRLGIGLGLGYYGGWGLGFSYPYGYGYGYPYGSYYNPYAYPPVYAQPPVVVQERNDDYYDDDAPEDPYQDNTPRNQKRAAPQDEPIDDTHPVNPDSLTYKPGTNRNPVPANRNYSSRDKVWIKPHWKHTGDGWIWIDGYWK